jgi:hypothetical protein
MTWMMAAITLAYASWAIGYFAESYGTALIFLLMAIACSFAPSFFP